MTDRSGEPPVRRVQAGSVVGGVLLGVLLAWSAFALVLLSGVSASPGPALAALVLSAVAGAVLVAHPRSRQAGTGFLLGLAVGMITGAGVCGVTVASVA
jgi:hypothetical protein